MFLVQIREQLNLLCTDTSLPGSQLTTMDINNDRTGVTENTHTVECLMIELILHFMLMPQIIFQLDFLKLG